MNHCTTPMKMHPGKERNMNMNMEKLHPLPAAPATGTTSNTTGTVNNNTNTNTLVCVKVWSTVWFSLCACLVVRRKELSLVFYSFLGCFLLASVLPSPVSRCAATRRASIGLLVTAITTYMILLQWTQSQSSTCAFTSCAATVTEEENVDVEGTAEFQALALVTGYLAFDLWHTFLHRHTAGGATSAGATGSMTFMIWENAATLSSFMIVLTKWSRPPSELLQFRRIALAWCAYKMVRLFMAQVIVTKKEQTTTVTTSPTLPSDSPSPLSTELVWTIHGSTYHLADFVDRHPGGKEAIMLGEGRPDCTALFESYHPFTAKHRQVLAKYKPVNKPLEPVQPVDNDTSKSKNNSKTTKRSASDNKPRPESEGETLTRTEDPFYDLLKQRVYATLQEQGFDPATDRGASMQRAVYYVWVLGGVVLSGYYHAYRANLLGSLGLAVFGWWMGALGHDAGHFAISTRYPLLNEYCVWGMSLLCNPVMWQHQHTYAHHSHTNELEHDPDLHHFTALLRVHRQWKTIDNNISNINPLYKYQRHLPYVIFAYMFVVFGECLKIPCDFIRTTTLYGMVEFTDGKRSLKRRFLAACHSVCYLLVIVVAPIWSSISITSMSMAAQHNIAIATSIATISSTPTLTLSSSTITIAISFLVAFAKGVTCATVHIAASGLLFAFFSQINHLNERSMPEAIMPKKNKATTTAPATATSTATRGVGVDNTADSLLKNNNNDDVSQNPTSTISPSSSRITTQDDLVHHHLNHSTHSHSWAMSQIVTSNNFCPNSALWHVLSNGLNLQIEHHLFPSLNHCHLWRIQPVVQATCAEFSSTGSTECSPQHGGVDYKCYDTWQDIFQATRDWLHHLSSHDITTTHIDVDVEEETR
jgi:fatty acid desaturase